jgi:glycerol 3-phosphatase-1
VHRPGVVHLIYIEKEAMGSVGEHSFSAPAQVLLAHGLLFDFDGKEHYDLLKMPGSLDCTGTIIDSTEAVVKHWHKEAAAMGVDPEIILATSHGRRSIDTFKEFDPSKANWECRCFVPNSNDGLTVAR